MTATHPSYRYLGLVFAGALATLGFAPFELPVFTLLSVAASYVLIHSISRNFWAGWLYGFGFFGAGTSWVFVSIYYHSQTPLVIAVLLTTLFVAALGLLFAVQFWLYKKLFPKQSSAGFIALWMIFEWTRSWLFTGFPWLLMGNAWIDTPLANWAPLGGVWLVSLSAVVMAVLLAEGFNRRSYAWPGGALIIYLLSFALPNTWTTPETDSISVALVQPNTPQATKWDSAFYTQHISNLMRLSEEAPSADWIIWPETAIPKLIDRAIYDLDAFLAKLDGQGQVLFSGFPMRTADQEHQIWRYQNALGILTGIPSFYQKQRLVPFGEYIPFENQLRGLIDFFNLPMSSFSLPLEPQQPLMIGDLTIASAICYEIAYPELVRDQASKSKLILTLSNDTWFGRSHGPDQHLQIARMRALENGRWLLRGTNNGLTAVIAPDGTIAKRLPRDQQGVLQTEIFGMEGQTPYQTAGLWPAALLTLVLLGIGLISRGRDFTLKQARATAIARLNH